MSPAVTRSAHAAMNGVTAASDSGTKPRPNTRPMSIARPPTIGTSPSWIFRPPGRSTRFNANATGRNANVASRQSKKLAAIGPTNPGLLEKGAARNYFRPRKYSYPNQRSEGRSIRRFQVRCCVRYHEITRLVVGIVLSILREPDDRARAAIVSGRLVSVGTDTGLPRRGWGRCPARRDNAAFDCELSTVLRRRALRASPSRRCHATRRVHQRGHCERPIWAVDGGGCLYREGKAAAARPVRPVRRIGGPPESALRHPVREFGTASVWRVGRL